MRPIRNIQIALAAALAVIPYTSTPASSAMMTCSPLAACPIKPVPVKDKTHFQKLASELPKIKEMLGQMQQHKGLTDQLQQSYGAPGSQSSVQAPPAMSDPTGYKPVLPPGADPSAAQSLVGAATAVDSALWTGMRSDASTVQRAEAKRQNMLNDAIVQAYSLAMQRRQAIAQAGKDATDLAQGVAKSANLRSDIAANSRARTMVAQSADTFAELMNAYLQLEAAANVNQVPAASGGGIAALSPATGATDGNFDAARIAALQDIAAGKISNSVFNAVVSHNARSAVMQNIEIAKDIDADILRPWEGSVAAIAADDAAMIERFGDIYKDPENAWRKLRTSIFNQIKVWKMPFGSIENLSDQGQYEQAANAGLASWQGSYNETVKLADLAVKSVNANPEAWGTLTAETKDRLSKPAATVETVVGSTSNDKFGSPAPTQPAHKMAQALNRETDLMPIASWITDVKEERFRQYFVTDDPTPRPVAEVKQIVSEIRSDKSLVDPGRVTLDQDLGVLQQNILSAQQVIGSDSKYAAQLAAAQQKYQAMVADVANATFVDP